MVLSNPEAANELAVSARATIADVARLANVSTKTASRVLAGSPAVREQTRSRVQQAATSLRFRGNAMARGLRSGVASSTIGFVFGDLNNPFYAAVAAGAAEAIGDTFSLIMASSEDSSSRERAEVQSMIERRVAALLIAPVGLDHTMLEGERHFGTPVVAVDRPLDQATSDVVLFDNRGGARSAVAALADSGHSRIAFVDSAMGRFTHDEREAGYRDAMMERSLPIDPSLVRVDANDVESAQQIATQLFSSGQPPTAVFAGNNRVAVGVYRAMQNFRPVALVGFDDFELAQIIGISVVASSPKDMGKEAGRLALSRLKSMHLPVERIQLPTTLVLRRSHIWDRG